MGLFEERMLSRLASEEFCEGMEEAEVELTPILTSFSASHTAFPNATNSAVGGTIISYVQTLKTQASIWGSTSTVSKPLQPA
jgi:hypothetical protein